MKIAFVCNEYPPRPHGGIGTFTQTVARDLVAAGHRVCVVGLGEAADRRMDEGVEVVTLKAPRAGSAAWVVDRLWLHSWLWRQVKAGRIEIIEVPDYEGWLPLPFGACPVVVRLHLSETVILAQKGDQPIPSVRWCERATLARHRHWIGVSAFSIALVEQVLHLYSRLQEVIFCPIQLPEPATDICQRLPERYILYPGAVSRRKGAIVLAEACRDILKQRKDLHLVYAGPVAKEEQGPNDHVIRNLLGPEINERVHFLGRVSHAQMIACMRGTLLCAFPSSLETFGIVVGEAMACGKAVIYTTIPPGPEVVDHGRNGLLADPLSTADVAAKLELLLEDPELCAALGTQAQADAQIKFSTRTCVEASLAFYAKVLSDFNRSV